jgi:hypothetical protein
MVIYRPGLGLYNIPGRLGVFQSLGVESRIIPELIPKCQFREEILAILARETSRPYLYMTYYLCTDADLEAYRL